MTDRWSASAHALNSEVITAIMEFAKIHAVTKLCATGRAGKEAVQCLLSPIRVATIQSFKRAIWVAPLPVLERLAEALVAPPLAAAARRALLDVLVEVAHKQNLCRVRVRALCFTRPATTKVERRVVVRFDFGCPRRHGVLQPMCGVPAAYRIRSSTDDLMLSCSHCARDQIEEDQMMLHCPRFGCCYDLCIRCAEDYDSAGLVKCMGLLFFLTIVALMGVLSTGKAVSFSSDKVLLQTF
ncbi:unnamed protein product [Durusdinium trenchii]|uniref:Uncharacterized protein n=1 Tax=Durusdinium trenchii TaxID=1381693 RepID=A0ABP0HV13_9DINO